MVFFFCKSRHCSKLLEKKLPTSPIFVMQGDGQHKCRCKHRHQLGWNSLFTVVVRTFVFTKLWADLLQQYLSLSFLFSLCFTHARIHIHFHYFCLISCVCTNIITNTILINWISLIWDMKTNWNNAKEKRCGHDMQVVIW